MAALGIRGESGSQFWRFVREIFLAKVGESPERPEHGVLQTQVPAEKREEIPLEFESFNQLIAGVDVFG